MSTYNDIGIGGTLDWNRIRKLMIIGIIAGCLVFAGDFLLGYGTAEEGLTGIEAELSTYINLSDGAIFWSAFLGLIGIPLEGLCYFGIYRLIAPYSQKYAHIYRSGILGYLAFGGCGVHVPCLACVFFYKHMLTVSPETALSETIRFGCCFLLPALIIFLIFLIVLCYGQIAAFAKGLTPYPKRCWIFSLPIGMAIAMVFKVFGNNAVANGITAGWISVGNIWMFAGLLITMKQAEQNCGISGV